MAWVTGGFLNKQVAAELGVTEITIKVHRGNVMRKMEAKSLADLVSPAQKVTAYLHPASKATSRQSHPALALRIAAQLM